MAFKLLGFVLVIMLIQSKSIEALYVDQQKKETPWRAPFPKLPIHFVLTGCRLLGSQVVRLLSNLIGRISPRGPILMYGFDKGNHIFDWSLRQYTVTKIKDVTGSSTRLFENLSRLRAKVVLVRKQCDRIEIAHNTNIVPNASPSIIQRYAPIKSNHIAAGLTHQLK